MSELDSDCRRSGEHMGVESVSDSRLESEMDSTALRMQSDLLTTSTEHATHGTHCCSLKSNLTVNVLAARFKTTRSWRMNLEYGPLWLPQREYGYG